MVFLLNCHIIYFQTFPDMQLWKMLGKELERQYQRYSKTKVGKLGAILIYIMIFSLMPQALKVVIGFLSNYCSPRSVYVIVMVSTAVILTSVYNLVMYFVYTLKIPFFEQYRIDPEKPWPWEQNPEEWNKTLKKTVFNVASTMLVVLPLLLIWQIWDHFQLDMDMERAPSFREMLPCLVFYQLMDDLLFFCHHWLLHTPLLYSIHKVHHEYTTAVSIAGYYGHYLEFLGSTYLAGIYGTMASYYFGPAHILMGVIWSILRNWDAFNSHSGYIFSWAPLQLIPFCTCDDYHNFHHSRNVGTLGGPLRIWDTVFGLNDDYWAFKEKQEAHRIKIQ